MKIFLIGFMGCGKSYWGKIWAGKLAVDFIELDTLIEQQEQSTIATVFEQKGENYFRKVESDILKQLQQSEQCIISTGGGTPCFFDNMNWMNEQGQTIYLKASPQFLVEKLLPEKDHRPILKNIPDEKLETFIAGKLKEREIFYNQAKIILDVEELNGDTILNFTAHNL
ncbi:MAG: shikimate kinase [Ferruginibacter sp.]